MNPAGRRLRCLGVVVVAGIAALGAAGCTEDERPVAERPSTSAPAAESAVPDESSIDVAPPEAAEVPTAPDPGVPGSEPSTDGTGTVVSSPDTPARAPEAAAAKPGSTTSLLPAASGLPDVLVKNSQGNDIALDETALLACAQNQIAWVALQQNRSGEAGEALTIAARRARDSEVEAVASAADRLERAASGTATAATVDDFLALCVDRGFEY